MKRRLNQNALWLCMAFGWLGLVSQGQAQEAPSGDVSQQEVSQELAKADDPGAQTVVLGMTLEAGANGRPKVSEVSAASPAWDAGIREGDLITSIDGLEHSSAESYVDWLDGVRKLVGDKKDGQSLAIEVNRDGTPLELRATIPESQIEEARKQKQKDEEQLQKQQLPQYPDQPQTPSGQEPQQQQPYPYPDNRGGGLGAIGFGGGGTGAQGTTQQEGSQKGTAMARLFAVNSSGQRGNNPNQPNQQNQPNQPNNQNQPNQFTPGANPIDQRPEAPNNNAPANNRGQSGPATIDTGQGGALQQRIEGTATHNSNSGAQATGQTGQTSTQTPGQISTQQQQQQGRRNPRQTQGQNQGIGQGQGSEVGSAMFQDDQRGMLVTVETIGLQAGNYLVAIADEGTLQTEGNRGSIQGMPQQQGSQQTPQQQGIQQSTPHQSIPQQGMPGARDPNTRQPGQQQMNQPGTQSTPAQPRSSAIFGDTEFFANAQEGTSDAAPQGVQDTTPQDLGDPSPNLDSPTTPADAAAGQNQTDQSDPNRQNEMPQNDRGNTGTGGGALVRIGILQVGRDGAGQLRQNVPNVRVDQIVGMAVAVYSLAGQSEVPNMEPGSQSEVPAGANGSLVAVGMIQLAQPNTVNGNAQNPQGTDQRRSRPAGGSSDGRIDQ